MTFKPILPEAPTEYNRSTQATLIGLLQQMIKTIPETPISEGWIVSNYTATRELDGSTATLSDVVNVLCTLINDLKQTGHLG